MTTQRYDEVVYADGWDDALIGHAVHFCPNGQHLIAVYSRRKIIETMVERDGSSWEEADEYLGFNIEGAYTMPGMPAFLVDDVDDD